ncbi:MAG: polyprenol monophosphomannose synthase, partial [Candidatus Methylomirabilis sp.]|nr:polyprenol monophosphomannose synthase [Deltaproteobacteria bacterium]
RHVPELVAALARVDVAIGSRAVPGGADIGRSPLRVAITRLANAYARLVLGLPVRDCNSGFRAFRREVIESVRPEAIESVGPSIVHEVLYKAHLLGFRIGESPIVFRERERGESNLSVRKLLQGYWMVLRLRLRHATGALLLPAASRDEAAS